ncbi:mandelate racemase/muconate lactonizing enzyme family protein [Cupriavidus pampae]|uniref:D-galactarolactone cycloisomerase n=1 Tax=Cupriavidus pampae TaxID=659251 RepID=A0ABM8WKH4_9BURK|nr:mandelate racemase/muconate lactonizing enzyme family protein [Cupriavidus pampae]CAG9167870.1 D-galactarolactone cycloisomerase [Cupriavidus pampae]
MKIARAEAILVSIPFQPIGIPPWSWGDKAENCFDTLLVRIETDTGIVGWGEAFSRNKDRALAETIRTKILPLIVGRDATAIARIKHDLEFNLHNFGRVSGVMNGISAVDIALWDILGKSTGRPLVDLIGGAFADQLPVYASLLRYADEKNLGDAIEQSIARGYRYIKLHEVDLDLIRFAVRLGEGRARFMLDTNCPWSVSETIRNARALADIDLMWLEEPVWPPENYDGLAQARAAGPFPIAAGENQGSLFDIAAMISKGAIDIAQPDVAKTGGVTELLRIRALCEATGVDFVPHCALFGPGQVATFHLNASTQSKPVVERLYCDFEEDLYGHRADPVDGFIRVPMGPGLGLDPDLAIVDKYRVN